MSELHESWQNNPTSAFRPRRERLEEWYDQLEAEEIGKFNIVRHDLRESRLHIVIVALAIIEALDAWGMRG